MSSAVDLHGRPILSFGIPELPFMLALDESLSDDDPFRIIWLRTPPTRGRAWTPPVSEPALKKACAKTLVYFDRAIAADVLYHHGLRCHLMVVTFPLVLPIRGCR